VDAGPDPAGLAPLGDNLLWAVHYINLTQQVFVHDPSGTFSPRLVFPPGQELPDAIKFSMLTEMTPGQIYVLSVKEDQTTRLDGNEITLNERVNFILCK